VRGIIGPPSVIGGMELFRRDWRGVDDAYAPGMVYVVRHQITGAAIGVRPNDMGPNRSPGAPGAERGVGLTP